MALPPFLQPAPDPSTVPAPLEGESEITRRVRAERRRAEEALRRQLRLTKAITDNAAVALFIKDERQHCVFMNPAAEALTGFTLKEMQGRPLHDVIHHTRPDGSRFPQEECAIDRAFPARAQMRGEEVFVHKDGHFYHVAFTASPILEDGRTVGTIIEVQDITERRRIEALRAMQSRVLELAIADTPLDEALATLVRTVESLSASGLLGSILLLDGDGLHLRHGSAPSLPAAYNAAIDGIAVGPKVGSCGTAAHTRRPVFVSDIATDPRWADFRDLALAHGLRACWSTPILSGQGEVLGTFAMYYRAPREASPADVELLGFVARSAALVIERKRAEQALREETRTLEVLNRIGTALAAALELDQVAQIVTDAATELSGAAFGAFFYNVVDEHGEAYTLYALSGAPREAFERFPMPRNSAVFAPTFRGEGVVRSDDITRDPRYGRNAPHHGMPEGHLPVRSYLAVPVVLRSGEVLGGLFLGHPEPGVFTARAERVVAGIAAQAAVAMDNARLYQAAQREVAARKAAEENLRRLNERLERLVEERTAALLREVEERRKAEEALRQGEKLQAIGQLTGGVAHDFNNILQVVSSAAMLLRNPHLAEERRVAVLDALDKAIGNATKLTRSLLAFARRQSLQPEAFDVNARLAGMAELLRSTLGSRSRIETDFAPDLWPAMADPSQLEVAILNLAANARDAMLPEGGTLTLRTRNAVLDATAERAAGEYVRVAVSDTGKGMPPAVLARAFEPFFTTKGPDKGTGLGLAQVHGFAKQSGGDIAIESTPGKGTTITLYLPRGSAAAQRRAPMAHHGESAGAALARQAGRTVLVVEDNPDVAALACGMLDSLGYATRRAANAAEALATLDAGAPVDAVFSDVVMPGPMNGVQLAGALRLRHPRPALVLASGYSEVLAEWKGRAVAEVLGKPYRLDELAAALERAFAAVEGAGEGPAPPSAPQAGPAGGRAEA